VKKGSLQTGQVFMLVFEPDYGERHSAITTTMKKSDLSISKQMVCPAEFPDTDIDTIGAQGVIDAIIETVGTTNPVYLSIDIDVIDPGICPGTGTPESGGWTTRELRQIIRGLEPLRIVGGDIVEVSPPYDNTGETTALAASDLVFEMISIMVKNPGFEGPNVEVAKPRLPKLNMKARDRVEL
jgi:hypothetical protein